MTFKYGEANAELGEEEGGAKRRWRAWNRAKEARELHWRASTRPLPFWRRRGRERVERGALRSGGEGECAGGGGRRGRGRGAGRARMPSTRRRGPNAFGRTRRGCCGEREEGEGAGTGAGLASLAGPVGWRRPASEQLPLSFFLKFFFQIPF